MGTARAFPNRKTARGERSGRAVLTEQDIRDIRELRDEGMTYMELSTWYSVSSGTISAIIARKTWRHVV